MRIAAIILPKVGNAGESLDLAHNYIKRELCKAFGGYTAIDSFGGWVSDSGELYQEAGVTYRTAVEFDENQSEAVKNFLRRIATNAGVMAGQLAMFVEMPDGTAEILDTSNEGKESANA